MKRIFAGILMSLGLMSGAKAALVVYDFTVINAFPPSIPANLNGVFAYNNAATALPGTPPYLSVGTWYAASYFSLGGSVATNPRLGLVDNITFINEGVSWTVDAAAFYGTFGSEDIDIVFYFPDSTFSGVTPNQMDGRKLSDLLKDPFSSQMDKYSAAYDEGYDNVVTALRQRVPAPASLALVGFGLLGLVARRRRD